ncbi:hypothetical protein Tco_1531600 [Tanacetum coccineum]
MAKNKISFYSNEDSGIYEIETQGTDEDLQKMETSNAKGTSQLTVMTCKVASIIFYGWLAVILYLYGDLGCNSTFRISVKIEHLKQDWIDLDSRQHENYGRNIQEAVDSRKEPEEPEDASKGRDVFNENPPHDELMAVSDIAQPVATSVPENVHIYFVRMVRVSVLNDTVKNMYNADRRGTQTRSFIQAFYA